MRLGEQVFLTFHGPSATATIMLVLWFKYQSKTFHFDHLFIMCMATLTPIVDHCVSMNWVRTVLSELAEYSSVGPFAQLMNAFVQI